MFFQALLAFVACPGVVAFLIPLGMASGSRPVPGIAAFLALGADLATLLWCVGAFYVSGKGTLAPWAPPRIAYKERVPRWLWQPRLRRS